MVDKKQQDREMTLEALYDVPVEVSVVLGKTRMQLSNLLKLNRGAVVELERTIGEPIDLYVNNKMIAKGEIVIVDNKIGVTLTEVTNIEKE